MVERAAELSLLITLENGKPLADARAEVVYAAEFFRWRTERLRRMRMVADTYGQIGGKFTQAGRAGRLRFFQRMGAGDQRPDEPGRGAGCAGPPDRGDGRLRRITGFLRTLSGAACLTPGTASGQSANVLALWR